jgi:hypothetical protein
MEERASILSSPPELLHQSGGAFAKLNRLLNPVLRNRGKYLRKKMISGNLKELKT